MENKIVLTEKKDNQEVQEMAFLVVSKNQIGVTNSLADLNAVIVSDGAEQEPVMIWMGEKNRMLEAEYKIQLQDEVSKVNISDGFGTPKLVTPDYNLDYNRVDRRSRETEPVKDKVLPKVFKHCR